MSEVGINEVKPAEFRVEVKAGERLPDFGETQVNWDAILARAVAFNSMHARMRWANTVLNELSGTPEKSGRVKRSVGKRAS